MDPSTSLFSRAQYDAAREQFAAKAARTTRLRSLAARREVTGRAMTDAERKRDQRGRDRELGQIPRVRHRRVRESFRNDLVGFGVTYFGAFLDHAPSEEMVQRLILPLQRMILGGGCEVILFPRSAGKTTWTKIALIWAIVYGHRRFVVVAAATREMAATLQEEVIECLAEDDMEMFQKDFPEVCQPIIAAEANSKKMRSVLVNGRITGMKWRGSRFVFPTVKDRNGDVIGVAGGAVFVAVGCKGSVKGINKKKDRPDFIIIDDPQTRAIATSPTECDRVENTIDGDLVGLRGQTTTCSIAMTVTPIVPGDIAARYADKRLHPEFYVAKAPYVLNWTERAEEMLPAFREAYYEDKETGDFTWELSRQFYLDHRDAFAGVKVIDDSNFVRGEEVDAIHHLLVMRSTTKDAKFLAEYMLDVSGEVDETELKVEDVMTNLTGRERNVLPRETIDVVAFVDVNTAAKSGLRWELKAVGPRGVKAVINYGSYPENGAALVPPKSDPRQKQEIIRQAMLAVVEKLVTMRLTREDTLETVHPVAICFDGGYEQDIVRKTVAFIKDNVRIGETKIYWSLGRSWKQFSKPDKGEEVYGKKDHIYRSVLTSVDKRTMTKVTKRFLVIHSDYWREVAQKSFFKRFPAPGSTGLFGKSPEIHRQYAEEVTYERLLRSGRDEATKKMSWEWYNAKKGHNHYGDTNYGAVALAHWEGLFSAQARAIQGAEDKKKSRFRKVKSVPLFRKIRRPGA